MSVNLRGVEFPLGATADLVNHLRVPVNNTPFVARHKVAVFVFREIRMGSRP